jgi:hypothetical protein
MSKRILFSLLFTPIMIFWGCGQNKNAKKKGQGDKPSLTEQYVSMDCQTGDITLTLNSDKTFDLTILFWDDKTNKHTGQESLKGSWIKSNKTLTINSDNGNKVMYELTTTSMKIGDQEINNKTYAFKSNDKDFFASKFDLTEKEQVDKFLLNATKQK